MANYNHLLHNEITNDVLRTIPNEALPQLKNLLKQNLPYAAQPYRFIDLMIDWKIKNPNVGVRFTCPDGVWEDGTFVAILTDCTYNIFFFTLEKSCERLCRAFRQTKLIEWSRGPYICGLVDDFYEKVIKVLELKGLIESNIESTTWMLKKEVALNFEVKCPDDVYIASLSPEDVPVINSLWPHSFPGSVNHLQNLISMNCGFGIFTKKDKRLVSWILLNEFGAHATLQTIQEFKRKGLAAILVKMLAKKLAEDGKDSITNIVRKNFVSQNLFKSIGFEKLNNICWVKFKEIVSKSVIVEAKM